MNKQKEKNTDGKMAVDKKVYEEILYYFPHLDLSSLKEIMKKPDDAELILVLLNEIKECKLNDKCNGTFYHEIPFIENDANGKKIIVIRRELCEKSKHKLQSKLWRQKFLLDDYIGKQYSDLVEAYKNTKRLLGSHSTSTDKIFNIIHQEKNDEISKFCIFNQDAEPFELFFHEYAIHVAKKGYNVAYVDLINFVASFKNKHIDSSKYQAYISAFKNADLIVFVSLDSIPFEELIWANLFSIFTEIIRNEKKIVIISSVHFNQIIQNSFNSSNKNVNLHGIIKKTIIALNKYFSVN